MIASLIAYRRHYILFQAIVIGLLFMIVYMLNLKNSIYIFYFLIVWNVSIYSWVLYNEFVKSPYFHPFIIFALITLQYCGFSPIQTAIFLNDGQKIYLGGTQINQVLTLGYLFLTLEHYLIYCGFFIYDNCRLRHREGNDEIISAIASKNINFYNIGVYNYLLVIILRGVNIIFPLASISSVLLTYSQNGYLVSLAILSYGMILGERNRTKNLFWLITIIEICLVLGSGMKQAIITPLLPYIIYLIIAYKQGLIKALSFSFIAKIFLIGVFIIGFVFPYISLFRQMANEQHKEWEDINVSEVVDSYINSLISKEDDKKKETGIEYFMSRAGSIASNSFSVNYADINGYSPKYFLYTTSALIPRIFWPDKPPMYIGSTAYYMSLGYTFESALYKSEQAKKTTSITLGFIGSTYIAFGFIGAIAFCLFAGYFTAKIWYFVKTRQNNIIAIWLFYSLMTTIFIDYENFIDCGLMFYAWSLVYILLIRIVEMFYYK